jgi:hypothetical protein
MIFAARARAASSTLAVRGMIEVRAIRVSRDVPCVVTHPRMHTHARVRPQHVQLSSDRGTLLHAVRWADDRASIASGSVSAARCVTVSLLTHV